MRYPVSLNEENDNRRGRMSPEIDSVTDIMNADVSMEAGTTK